MELIQKKVLGNGLTVVTEKMPNLRSISLGVWLKKGSRHESAAENGISHFIEHLLFKGTANRSAQEIALTIDSIGGQIDAFTAKEYTCFYSKVLDEHLPVALDLLSDIVLHPNFDPAEIEKERKVIFEEIRMVDDTPDELVYDLFNQHLWPDHPLGRPIQGTIESVTAMTPGIIGRYFKESYQPGNLLITATGNLEHETLVGEIRRAFEPLANGAPPPVSTPPRLQPGILVKEKKELGQVHVCLGVRSLPLAHEARFQEYVLNTLLGGTMSSRLFQDIREERGLAYNVFSSVNSFMDTGYLMVYAATSPESAEQVVRLIQEEFKVLKEKAPSEREMKMARDHLKGSLMLSLESSSSRMSNLARQEVYFHRPFTLNEILEGIDRVRAEEVRALAEMMFDRSACAMAVLGNTSRFRLTEDDLSF
ncbi:MAG TPA: pitrilysin family protein [Candidatus Polarisedimenticolia bacterium]|jgi:predicted Zn-dependent peptidase|nr:pitrilysin family protein [Candidatus Polarisedimenticolia bacterium]